MHFYYNNKNINIVQYNIYDDCFNEITNVLIMSDEKKYRRNKPTDCRPFGKENYQLEDQPSESDSDSSNRGIAATKYIRAKRH